MQCLVRATSYAILLVTMMRGVGGAPSGMEGDNWQDPCGWGSAPLSAVHPSFADLMQSLKTSALELNYSAAAFQKFLTTGGNARVSAADVNRLNQSKVTNFPHDFRRNPKANVSEVLITDYIYLSKVYIFFQQAKNNSIACDTRPDASQAQAKIQSLLYKAQLTLCDVSTYLTASGHSMPADQIPDKDEVLDNSAPNMRNISRTCEDDFSNTRNQVDFILARDTVTTSRELYLQYVDISHRLSGHNRP